MIFLKDWLPYIKGQEANLPENAIEASDLIGRKVVKPSYDPGASKTKQRAKPTKDKAVMSAANKAVGA